MANTKVYEVEWDSLLIPEDLSTDEKEEQHEMVAEFISTQSSDQAADSAEVNQVVEIEIDDSLLDKKELTLDKISSDELFLYFQEEKTKNDTSIHFPKIKRINILFWFLHNFGEQAISESKIMIKNSEELSVIFYNLMETARFFGFINRVIEEGKTYFVPTNKYEEFMEKDIQEQYLLFLASLGQNATVSEAIQVQLNDPIYDSISRQMVHNLLVPDPNIQEESLTNEEVTKIVNNLRYWYLNIKKAILDK